MRRLLALLILAVALAVAVSACATPANNPCAWHNGVQSSRLSYNGQTLVVICKDGTIVTRHP